MLGNAGGADKTFVLNGSKKRVYKQCEKVPNDFGNNVWTQFVPALGHRRCTHVGFLHLDIRAKRAMMR